ncbi:MAG: STAS/SEC14 domain-containing protein [Alphaproteobacteria bacterium]
MITIEHHHRNFLVIRAAGTLTKTDYDAAIPELESAMARRPGKPNLLIVLEDFQGWDLEAAWKDLRFDLKHYSDFGRIAVAGEGDLEKWMTKLSTPFTGAEIRYFDRSRMEEAEAWLAGNG